VASGVEKKGLGKRGLSLIIAVMLISIMMIFASDLILSSQVNLELTVTQRDNVKAEYMAKSAHNLALFLISADFGIDLFLASPQSPMKTPMSDSSGDIWSIMNGMPIGGEDMVMLAAVQESFGLSSVMDSGVLEQMKLFDGDFIVNVSDEGGKINVNNCATVGRCPEVLLMLEALFSCPVEKVFLEEKKLKAREMIYRLKDFIDPDNKAEPESGVSDEADPYRDAQPPYAPKNAPFDSLSELRMVSGWDDEIYEVFSPFITVFPFQKSGDKPKLNINTSSRELLGCLIPEARSGCGEKFHAALKSRDDDKAGIANSTQKVSEVLKDAFCYTPVEGVSPQDPRNRSNWFDVRSNVFRIESKGRVGNQERTLTAVVERTMPDPKKNVTAAYKILYWKLI